MSALRDFFYFFIHGGDAPENPMIWHERDYTLPRRTIDAGLRCRVWRRKGWDGKWEYKHRPMTKEEQDEELQRRAW